MMISIAFAIAVSQTTSTPAYRVTSVDRHISFAGKLGDRVDLSFQVEVGDHVDTIRVGRQHTRFGRPLEVKVGDRVELVDFHDHKSQLLMSDQVRVVKN